MDERHPFEGGSRRPRRWDRKERRVGPALESDVEAESDESDAGSERTLIGSSSSSDIDSDASSAGDDDDSWLHSSGEAAGKLFYDLIVQMTVAGEPMSAKSACILCHWACRGGLEGPAKKIAMRPDKKSLAASSTVSRASMTIRNTSCT